MARRLFTLCSALSLLMCAAVCGLWVRSYFVGQDVVLDFFRRERGVLAQTRVIGGTVKGGLAIAMYHWRHEMPPSATADDYRRANAGRRVAVDVGNRGEPGYPRHPDLGKSIWHKLGFVRLGAPWSDPRAVFQSGLLIVPFWFLALAFAGLPVTWSLLFRRQRSRQRRLRLGLCPKCGYDLRASPERCPECGAASARGAEST